METPPLSTLQACVILRPLLVLSRNEKANKFASLFFARIISVSSAPDRNLKLRGSLLVDG